MAASREDIRDWFRAGVQQGATHMLVMCDTFDWSDYPVFVQPDQDVRTIVNERNGNNMQQLMEVYDLKQSETSQVDTHARQFNY